MPGFSIYASGHRYKRLMRGLVNINISRFYWKQNAQDLFVGVLGIAQKKKYKCKKSWITERDLITQKYSSKFPRTILNKRVRACYHKTCILQVWNNNGSAISQKFQNSHFSIPSWAKGETEM